MFRASLLKYTDSTDYRPIFGDMNLNFNRRSPRYIYLFTLLSIGLLLMHFALTACYDFRTMLPASIRTIADRYSYPLFHQGMDLFAPDVPMYSMALEYRIFHHSGWNDWADISQHAGYDEHSRMELVEQSLSDALNYQVLHNYYSVDGVKQYDRIVSSSAFRNALYFALKMHDCSEHKVEFDSMQVRLNYRFTASPTSSEDASSASIEFPAYSSQSLK